MKVPLTLLGIALVIFLVPAINYFLTLSTQGQFMMGSILAFLIGFPSLIALMEHLDRTGKL